VNGLHFIIAAFKMTYSRQQVNSPVKSSERMNDYRMWSKMAIHKPSGTMPFHRDAEMETRWGRSTADGGYDDISLRKCYSGWASEPRKWCEHLSANTVSRLDLAEFLGF